MKNTILSEQIFDTPPPEEDDPENNNDTETTLHCDHCKKPMGEWGLINIIKLETTKQITFLCSKECKKKFKSIRVCPHCGTEFNITLKHSYNVKFCSRKCYSDSTKLKCGLCVTCSKQIEGFEKNKSKRKKFCSSDCRSRGTYKYKTHFFCDNCHKWISIKDAIKRDNVKRDPYLCPKLGCNGNPLRINSRHSIANQKRKNVKWIE